MSELKIKIPKEAHEKLKKLAKDDYRSLTNYITISLIKLANGELSLSLSQSQVKPGATSTSTSASTSTPTIEQLKKMGVTSFKLDNTQDLLSQRQAFQEEKLNKQQALQEEKIKEKQRNDRIKYLKERMKDVLGYLFSYLENDADPKSQKYINVLLNMSNKEYEDWLQQMKYEDEHYATDNDNNDDTEYYMDQIKTREEKLKININDNDIYKQIKKYCIDHELTEALYDLIEYPINSQDNIEYYNDKYDNFIRSALGSPADFKYSNAEWQLLIDSLTWEEED